MPPDQPHVLLGKALDDERLALLVVENAAVSDEQIGFLAQQSIEKAFKAVLSLHGVRYRRTHDLAELMDILRAAGVAYPAELDASITLTPFAAEMRYDYLPPEPTDEQPLDRAGVMRLVRTSLAWVEEEVCGKDPDDQ